MAPNRRRHRTAALIGVVVMILLVEAALVVGVFVSPGTADRLKDVVASVDRSWNGTDTEPGLRTKTARAISDGYHEWVTPLWSEQSAPTSDPEFSECVECHKDYAKTRRFPTVYMNHPLHAEIGVACDTCHPQNVHPNPPRPQEKTCAGCHTEVQDRDGCPTCHPPGSLPHFYLLGAPRQSSTECDVCHPTGSFGSTASVPKIGGTFTGSDPTMCQKCHAPAVAKGPACLNCHQEPTHPSNWVSKHGGEALGMNDCYTCHTGLWCTSRCHAVTFTSPLIKQPLPDLGVRP
jgi:hypothetical protein